jgi:hypothetical protein
MVGLEDQDGHFDVDNHKLNRLPNDAGSHKNRKTARDRRIVVLGIGDDLSHGGFSLFVVIRG